MILALCDSSSVLSIFRIIKIVIRIITIIVPIILIVSSMLVLLREMKGGDSDLVSKSLKSLLNKSIAAILVFMIPTFVNILANIASVNTDYKACISNATTEGINGALYNEAEDAIKRAKVTISNADYQSALSKINKIKDKTLRDQLQKEIGEVKEKIDLQVEVNTKLSSGTEEDYNRLLAKVNALEDGDFKKSLLATLEKMKKRIEEENLANAEKVLSKIISDPPIKKSKNITVNFYRSSGGQNFTFWLYIPDKMQSNMPIIFFMHDLGCRGDDYHNGTTASVYGGPMREVMQGSKKWDAIIVHAQVPDGQYSQGYRGSYIELLNKLADGFKADKKRISVMGFSNGCYGVWAIVGSYQEYFSAAVPIGCSPKNVNPNIFKTTPMWSLVGSGDGAHNLPGFAATVNALNGNSKHSNSQYKSHNCLYPAQKEGVLLEYNVVEWMLEQRRK